MNATTYLVICTKPTALVAVRYLEGPMQPEHVRKHGYSFTCDASKAWPFPSEAQARNKARIVNVHIGWTKFGENHMDITEAKS